MSSSQHHSTDIMIIAGEVSGDMHAAGLVRALRQRLPQARLCAKK